MIFLAYKGAFYITNVQDIPKHEGEPVTTRRPNSQGAIHLPFDETYDVASTFELAKALAGWP